MEVDGYESDGAGLQMGIAVFEHHNETDFFLFLYAPERYQAILDQLTDFSAEPSLNFTWDEAAELGNKVRAWAEEHQASKAVGATDGRL